MVPYGLAGRLGSCRIAELRALRGELNRLVARAEALDPADCDPDRICHLVGPS